MIELPDGISPDDVQQWLRGGVFLVNMGNAKTPEWQPAMMDGLHDRETLRVRLLANNWEGRETVPVSAVRAHWPLCGSVNVRDALCAIHVERVPAKQYRRTFNTSQLQQTIPKLWELTQLHGRNFATVMRVNSVPVIRALFYTEYPENYDEALGWLADGWVSVAVNPRMIVAGDDVGKRVIYYRGSLAATIIGDDANCCTDELTRRLIDRASGGRYTWQ